MYILNERQTEIINSDYVERFVVAEKPDAGLCIASYARTGEKQCVTIGRYKNLKEAQEALAGLFLAMAAGETSYRMPPSLYYDEERTVRDARTKRRGGS